jgi:hypothetical protein
MVKHVFLKVKVKRSSLRLRCFPKLVARYCGPFDIVEMIGPIAYMLVLHASMRVHNVFHVSLLNKCIPEPNHIIDWTMIWVENERDLWVEPICILYRKFKVLRENKLTR